jgi:hypothetical protein
VAYPTHGHHRRLLLSLLRRRLDHLRQRLLDHVTFVLKGGHLFICLLVGHLRGPDVDLLIGPRSRREAGYAHLPNVLPVGDIPVRHRWIWCSVSIGVGARRRTSGCSF